MSVDPLPCPFCGGTEITTREGSTFRWRLAECEECGATSGEVRRQTIARESEKHLSVSELNEKWDADAADAAIARWNERATDREQST